MLDLIVVGDIVPDLILHATDIRPEFGQAEKLVDNAILTLGGSAVITACAAARLGLNTALLGVVGDDLFGQFMLSSIATRGVDTSLCVIDPTIQTGVTVILDEPGDRAILTHSGSVAALVEGHVAIEQTRSRHLHVGSAFLLTGLFEHLGIIFRRAHDAGMTTSLDPNWDPSGMWNTRDWLENADVFLPNEEEAIAISGTLDINTALPTLQSLVGTIATKRGPGGGIAAQHGTIVRTRARTVERKDAVGAGDNFNAGFLYGYIHGWSLQESLDFAVACGSLSMREVGGTGSQPTFDEVTQWTAASQ